MTYNLIIETEYYFLMKGRMKFLSHVNAVTDMSLLLYILQKQFKYYEKMFYLTLQSMKNDTKVCSWQ